MNLSQYSSSQPHHTKVTINVKNHNFENTKGMKILAKAAAAYILYACALTCKWYLQSDPAKSRNLR